MAPAPYEEEIRRHPYLLQWYDASKITGVSDGGRITAVGDNSGHGWKLTATSTGPIYRATGYDGYPCMEFNGSDTSLTAAAEVLPYTNITIIIVCPLWTGGRIVGWENDASGTNGLGFFSGPSWIIRQSSNNWDITTGGMNGGNPFILTLRIHSALGGTAHVMQPAFRASYTNAAAVSWGSAGQNFHLGSSGNNSALMTGKIAEMLTFRRYLTTDSLYRMMTLLSAKYGGTLISGDQLQSVPPSKTVTTMPFAYEEIQPPWIGGQLILPTGIPIRA